MILNSWRFRLCLYRADVIQCASASATLGAGANAKVSTMKSTWFLLAALAVCVPAAAADMYSWTDASGVKHFSDSPPPANITKSQKLKVKGGITTNDDSAPPAAAETKAAGPALAAAAGYAPEDIKHNCEVARKNATLLDAQKPTPDANGAAPSADAVKAHQNQVDKTSQQIKLFCSN